MLEEFENDGWDQLNDSLDVEEQQPYLPNYKIEQGLNILESRQHSL